VRGELRRPSHRIHGTRAEVARGQGSTKSIRLASPLLLPRWSCGKNRNEKGTRTMMKRDFEKETKWCDACQTYPRYLQSVDHSFCVECGSRVRLFSKFDAESFGESLVKKRWHRTGS
jgi:hypothetical protein